MPVLVGSTGKPAEKPDPILGSERMRFGKHKDLTFQQVAQGEHSYCKWVLTQKEPEGSQMQRFQAFLRIWNAEKAAGKVEDPPDQAAPTSHGQQAPVPDWVQRLLAIGDEPQESQEPLRALRGLPSDKLRLLHEYQRQGIAIAVQRGGRVLLADEMGLGKTVQALGIAAFYRREWPVLVAAPASLRFVWRKEVEMWLPGASAQVIMSSGDAFSSSKNFYIVSYELLTKHEHFRRTHDGATFRIVICDESHFIKSGEAARTRAIVPVVQAAQHAILLTGTPALNNAFELYPQLDALLPGVIPSARDFGQRYCVTEISRHRNQEIFTGTLRPQELSQALRGVMLRRRKADVLNQLPPKRWRSVPLELAGEEELNFKGDFGSTYARLALAKSRPVTEYVDMLVQALPSPDKLLVFFHHEVMGDALQAKLQAEFCMRIDGKTPQSSREQAVTRFQEDPSVRVALLSITACGTGLSLTAASVIVFAELMTVPGLMAQAEDRAHRVGQTKAVDIHYLVAPGTMDDTMLASLARKRSELRSLLTAAVTQVGQVHPGQFPHEQSITSEQDSQFTNDLEAAISLSQADSGTWQCQPASSRLQPRQQAYGGAVTGRTLKPAATEADPQFAADLEAAIKASQASCSSSTAHDGHRQPDCKAAAGSALEQCGAEPDTQFAADLEAAIKASQASCSSSSHDRPDRRTVAQSARPLAAAAASMVDDAALTQLVSMGFCPAKAAAALRVAAGSLEAAIEHLTAEVPGDDVGGCAKQQGADCKDTWDDSDVEVEYDSDTAPSAKRRRVPESQAACLDTRNLGRGRLLEGEDSDSDVQVTLDFEAAGGTAGDSSPSRRQTLLD
eukprot:TRINITY_DN75630_c0_g1_i1.p1 TRINITY_DN75630_c0_g1~~TRINITY_DN75630_c0_g1_i1.p1  ORF type:complete len:858 (+),score=157.19 TRINITY_DN75630_c0_g1_i1:37-2574(+)